MRENTLITIIVACVAFAAGWFAGAEYQRRNSENTFRIQGTDWHWEFQHPKDGRSSFYRRGLNEELLGDSESQTKSDWRDK